ncbi:hypothetical protein DFP72DRAFT_849575 [Ephemerocybe angulata]|uniref:Uncharacterized protein n=1 Tax=Ephemerocybe angulata TaxID=980116 RepID=A0A8H6HU02_9AGAR|nr:hypothetical protein DFP72DRAFT_849575 [Tulosesus angulatus]
MVISQSSNRPPSGLRESHSDAVRRWVGRSEGSVGTWNKSPTHGFHQAGVVDALKARSQVFHGEGRALPILQANGVLISYVELRIFTRQKPAILQANGVSHVELRVFTRQKPAYDEGGRGGLLWKPILHPPSQIAMHRRSKPILGSVVTISTAPAPRWKREGGVGILCVRTNPTLWGYTRAARNKGQTTGQELSPSRIFLLRSRTRKLWGDSKNKRPAHLTSGYNPNHYALAVSGLTLGAIFATWEADGAHNVG